ncbi:hypothetical protein [Aquisphaera insulae]|uniref:hypothetical protein n=1 Tax=Aquisphaera insulae TaxID=2712864 RepID=UPI0013EA5102|nr:hypothetical protein [Aquisphaera insulae]
MATQQRPVEATLNPAIPAIENELPTYRAVSTRAILAFLCGLVSLFSIANPFFYVFAILAIILGTSADRSIQKFPDMLTGRWLAQAGIAFGLVFGLGILTITSIQAFMLQRNAEQFARHYANVIKTGELGDVLLLGQPPLQRKSTTAKEILDRMSGTKGKESAMMEMKIASIRDLKRRVDTSANSEIHFARTEKMGSEGMLNVALAVFEVHGSPAKDSNETEQYAMAIIKSDGSHNKVDEWWVEEVVFPYKLKTAELPEAHADDDGHGHPH